MTIRCSDNQITSDDSPHSAHYWRSLPDGTSGWRCTWLPDRHLTEDEARAAMKLADTVAIRGLLAESLNVEALIGAEAGDLGLTGADAEARITAASAELAATEAASTASVQTLIARPSVTPAPDSNVSAN
jgi:hypothetical protein